MEHIRLFIVDDNFVARRGLRTVLEKEESFSVIGEAASGLDLLKSEELKDADMVLMDIRMAGMGGIQATAEVKKKYPEIIVLAMTSVDDPIILANIINAGSCGYMVYGQFQPNEMIDAIKKAAAGEKVFIPQLDQFFDSNTVNTLYDIKTYYHDPLTAREEDVLNLIGNGFDNSQISAIMGINEKTVKNYVTRIYSKLGVTNRREAILYVLNHILTGENY